jgi:acetoin utilization deacetylase AcuC-like enzyme
MDVALYTHPGMLGHQPRGGHPERPERLAAVTRALAEASDLRLEAFEAPLAEADDLALVHDADYLRSIETAAASGGFTALDADTDLSPGSYDAARRAVGAVAAAVRDVAAGRARRAFCAVRPPGHHAEPARAMGFCLFNNAAVAACHARSRWGLARVAVVDFDVHHGNGTQAIFWDDPGLFYVSSHQSPCYPCTGLAPERGGSDNVLNLPLAPGSGGPAFRRIWTDIGLPALRAFRPELVIASAGFDAHKADPLAELRLETADFTWITQQLLDVGEGRLVSVLEGGYDLAALGASAAAHVRCLMDA